jgi:hypothetical protein
LPFVVDEPTEDEMKARDVILAAGLLGAAGTGAAAVGQGVAGYDPEQFPAIHCKVAQYSLTARGEVDGLILDDGTQVHMPPHLGAQLVSVIKPGDQITVRGLKARAVALIDAVSVTNDATNLNVVDIGPPGPRGGVGQVLQASGHVKAPLHGPRGDLNGVLLEDGTIVNLPPDEADRLAAELAVGQPLYVTGQGVASPFGKAIEAQQIGPSAAQLAEVQMPPPPGPRREPSPPPSLPR